MGGSCAGGLLQTAFAVYMKCEECGSTLLTENGNLAICENCGDVCEIVCFREQMNLKLGRVVSVCTQPCKVAVEEKA